MEKYLITDRIKIEEIITGNEEERNTGIEPASQAWEAHALPMC